MDDRFEALKKELFMAGQDALEDFLDYDFDPDEDDDTTESRLDQCYEQMPDDVLNRYYEIYGI